MTTTDLQTAAATIERDAPRTTGAPPQRPAPEKQRARKRYVMDWRSQFRGSLFSVCIVAGMLVLVNVIFYHLGEVSGAAETDQVRALLSQTEAQRRVATFVLSALFLLGFTVLRMLETHKVHGAAYNICRRLAEVEAGDYNVFVRLRDADDLQGVATSANDLIAALRWRTQCNVESLAELARRAEDFGAVAWDLRAGIEALLEEQKRLLH